MSGRYAVFRERIVDFCSVWHTSQCTTIKSQGNNTVIESGLCMLCEQLFYVVHASEADEFACFRCSSSSPASNSLASSEVRQLHRERHTTRDSFHPIRLHQHLPPTTLYLHHHPLSHTTTTTIVTPSLYLHLISSSIKQRVPSITHFTRRDFTQERDWHAGERRTRRKRRH